jgi:hypothetical protein
VKIEANLKEMLESDFIAATAFSNHGEGFLADTARKLFQFI